MGKPKVTGGLCIPSDPETVGVIDSDKNNKYEGHKGGVYWRASLFVIEWDFQHSYCVCVSQPTHASSKDRNDQAMSDSGHLSTESPSVLLQCGWISHLNLCG